MASWDMKKKMRRWGVQGFLKNCVYLWKNPGTPLLKLMWMLLLTLIKRKDGYEQRLGGGRGLGRGAAQPWSTPFFFLFYPKVFSKPFNKCQIFNSIYCLESADRISRVFKPWCFRTNLKMAYLISLSKL